MMPMSMDSNDIKDSSYNRYDLYDDGEDSSSFRRQEFFYPPQQPQAPIDFSWYPWAAQAGIILNDDDYPAMAPNESKILVEMLVPELKGKGGILANKDLLTDEVICRIPRSMVLSSKDLSPAALKAVLNVKQSTWCADLTAATLSVLYDWDESDNYRESKQDWMGTWCYGYGWGTLMDDLGTKIWNAVEGNLMASNKSVQQSASLTLSLLTKARRDKALHALTVRSRHYHNMGYALAPLVKEPSKRLHSDGSIKQRQAWDVADVMSHVLARVTTIQGSGADVGLQHCVVPIHCRLSHDETPNTQLLVSGDEILMVATRKIKEGEPLTRNYLSDGPAIDGDVSTGSLRLLTQFGLLPPNSSSR